MPTIRTRAAKGAKLTSTEADTNMKRTATLQGGNYNLTAAHNRDFHELANGVVATLPTASGSLTETGDWEVTLKAAGASATVNRNSQTIDGAASNITLSQYDVVTIRMNAAGNAFYIADRYTAEKEYDNGNTGTAKTIDWAANGRTQKVNANGNVTFTFTAPVEKTHLQLKVSPPH